MPRVEVVGADLLTEVADPCVFWVVDGTPAAVRAVMRSAGRSGRIRTVSPVVGQRPERRGPSVALLAHDAVLAADHLAQLLPVRVVPLWIGGAFVGGPIRARFGRPLQPEAGENPARFTDRVADTADALAGESDRGWWQVLRASAPDAVPTLDGTIPPVPDGWRQRWARTAPGEATPGIWRR